MVRYCFKCYKKCGKGEYKNEKEIKYDLRLDYPAFCYTGMKSPQETPHFYKEKVVTNSYCLSCYENKIPLT